MTYKEQVEKAQKAKTAERINPQFITFENKGDEVLGSFLARNEVPGKREDTTYFQYLFDTDEGPVKFHLGSIADGEIGAQLKEGQVYLIIYQGKEELGGGRSVNRFDCFRIPADKGK